MKKALIPAAIIAALALASGVHADGPTASGTIAGCDAFTVNVSGLQSGDQVVVEQGSSAPGMIPMDDASGTAYAVLAATTDPWFTADVVLERGEQLTVLFHQLVDCDGSAPAVDPTTVTPAIDATPKPKSSIAATLTTTRHTSERLMRFGKR